MTLTPTERKELGAAVLSRLESEMRAAGGSWLYCRLQAKRYGGTWKELREIHKHSFRVLYGIRRKARADVEFDRATLTYTRADLNRTPDPFLAEFGGDHFVYPEGVGR